KEILMAGIDWAIASVIGVVVAAAVSGVGTYMSVSAQQQQASDQSKAARMQAEAEAQASEARRQQGLDQAEAQRKTLLSLEAGSGFETSSGSLLENEMQLASTSEYAAQMAKYNHDVQSSMLSYQSKLFKQRAGEFSPLLSGGRSK